MQWLIWITIFLFQMQNSRIQKLWLLGCIRNSLMLRSRVKSDRFPIKMNQDFHLRARAHLKGLFYTQVSTFPCTLERRVPVRFIIFPFYTKQFQAELAGNKISISRLVSRLSYLDSFPEDSWITRFSPLTLSLSLSLGHVCTLKWGTGKRYSNLKRMKPAHLVSLNLNYLQ